MIEAAEMEVRAEARRHPDDPWRMKAGDTHEFAAAIADARKRLRNELLAARYRQVEQAVTVRDDYEARGWPVPQWARNTCAWAAEPNKITELYQFDEGDDAKDVADAIAALKAVLR
ncbi:hypothetical protein NLM16_01320 [Bradyrhizobium brasilense]|uniref:hypothetical protein n=1 Tax=Bradyrhizobium brasilense TaxID=1419277 RepID=UPI0028773558|nr:hypothetical protein [Bradyrhizobium brasilense]MCP3412735.1 hypothetical protein [Bradyrhizobium brasilense]